MVAPLVAAAGISALGSLAGGIAGMFGAKSARKQAQKMADSAVQRRVKDAEKAGIHPLYALGANVHSPAPVNVMEPLSQGLRDMGQDVSRAVAVGGSVADRNLQTLQLERAGLENDLLRVQIRNASAPAVGPGSPVGVSGVIPGQGDSISPVSLPFGLKLGPRADVHKAQFTEDNWGEIADAIYGLAATRELLQQPSVRDMIWRMPFVSQARQLGDRFRRPMDRRMFRDMLDAGSAK